jgi:non-ribosomal peptide synthetase component E (peptide arylation enzyme)
MNAVRKPIPGVVYPPAPTLQRYVEHGVLTHETLVDGLAHAVRTHPDRVAVSEQGALITYRELDAITDRAALAFIKLGLKPLDPVIFQVANTKEMVCAFIACLKAGLIPLCTLAAHRQQEIGYLGRHCGVVAHIIDGDDPKFDFLEFAREVRSGVPTLRTTIVLRAAPGSLGAGEHDFDALVAGADAGEAARALTDVERDPFQVALYQLSGGTSGVPKIIPRFHNEFLYTMRTVIDWHKLDEHTVAYMPAPLMHNAPMACFWGPALLSGGEVAVLRGLDLDAIGALFAERRPNWMLIAPPILWRLKERGLLTAESFAHVRGFTTINNAAKLRALTGAPVYTIFGMTEGLLCWTRDGDPQEVLDTTVGQPLSPFDEVRLLEPGTERDVAEGDVGELVVRGPCTLHGYFDAEERNRQAFTSDGYYRSGDLMSHVRIDGKLYLKFWGRIKDVIDRGGEKINAEEVELACADHPKVGAIAIVPMPDPEYGERACAFVIPSPGSAHVTVAELGAHLGGKGLAKFKWPERVEVVQQFPLTASAKLSKPLLKDMIATILADERQRAS